MRVLTVCKFNQARSVAMASAIKHLYPKIDIHSAGTHCDPDVAVSMRTLDTLRDWGIEPLTRATTPLHNRINNGNYDLILCADSFITRDVCASLASSAKVVDITGLTNQLELIPTDPRTLDLLHFREELGKVIVLAFRALRSSLVPLGPYNYSLLLSGDSTGVLARKAVLWAISKEQVVIDTNWSRPNVEGWKLLASELQVPMNYFEPMSLLKGDVFKIGHVNVSRFESDNYQREILSYDWMKLLANSGKGGKLLVSGFQPKKLVSKIHSILGLIHSDRSCDLYL